LSIKPSKINSDFFLPPLHGHRACNITSPRPDRDRQIIAAGQNADQ
jgi:hypothetical protein